MNNKYSKISVCIATYNGEIYIKEQLNSILNQLSDKDEVIISDDGSSDNTKQVIKSLDDPRITIVDNKYKKGYTNNFQNALVNATGDIIFFSDQDDIWLNNKVKVCISLLEEYDFIVSNAIVVNSEKKILYDSFFNNSNPYTGLIGNLFKFAYLGCCMCFKREVAEFALPFPKNSNLCTHDNWLFLIGISFFKVHIEQSPLILYRRHNNNTSFGRDKNKKRNSPLFMLKYRIYLIKNLIIFYFKKKIIRIFNLKS